jgi:hypothetical protein
MRDPKEAMKAAEKSKKAAEAGAAKMQPTDAVMKMEYCHGSVCLGSQKPTHCICPTDKK